MPDFRYETYRKESDWIQKYIFPGGLLPSLSALQAAMIRHTSFHVEHLQNIGIHYAPTLRAWRERFEKQIKTIEALGYDKKFQRMWRYYLAYCEAAFATRELNNLHLVLARPNRETHREGLNVSGNDFPDFLTLQHQRIGGAHLDGATVKMRRY